MKTFLALTVVGIASAHKPVPASHWAAKGAPLSVENIGAMGQSYHNALKYCLDKTINWIDELGVPSHDITYDNTYGGEFDIDNKVPDTYALIKGYVGTYWDAPELTMDSGNKRILGYSYPESNGLIKPEHVPSEYEAANDLDWVIEHNMPHGEASHKTTDIKRTDAEYKGSYKMFYNIQETGNYCNHSLKSAWKAMIKVQKFDVAAQIEAEMAVVAAQWDFILKKQIAPMRWNMSMWTRFNIAESSVRVIQEHWKEDKARVNHFLDTYATDEVLAKVGWTRSEFENKRQNIFTDVVENWISETDKWINSCYDDTHDDRIVRDGDQICRYDDIRVMIYSGEKQAKAIFEDLLTPILHEINADDRAA